jgi:DNA-binding transcriptional LysR family regulator
MNVKLHERNMALVDVETFVRVAETGSVTRAAADLGVPKSTVSRRVRRLEDDLGVELLARKARSFTLTPTGLLLVTRAAGALAELAAAERAVRDSEGSPSGRLRITAPADIGNWTRFDDLLAEYRARWPAVELELELTPRRVDLVEEGFDLAFRAHAEPLPSSGDLVARRLLTMTSCIVAAPAYLERHGTPRRPEQLVGHDCLTFAAPGFASSWKLTRGRENPRTFPIRAVVRANEPSSVIRLAERGVGIAVAPDAVLRRASGRLVRVLPQWSATGARLSLVWPLSRHMAPRVRAFVDLTASTFGAADVASG